jgi:hypothetical protein
MPDHEEGIKFIIRTRLSHIHAQIDKTTVLQTGQALGHLLADISAYLNGLSAPNE